MTADLSEAVAIIRDLVDPDACWYDHHGYCQAHGWTDTEPICPHARAKDFLRAQPGYTPDWLES